MKKVKPVENIPVCLVAALHRDTTLIGAYSVTDTVNRPVLIAAYLKTSEKKRQFLSTVCYGFDTTARSKHNTVVDAKLVNSVVAILKEDAAFIKEVDLIRNRRNAC